MYVRPCRFLLLTCCLLAAAQPALGGRHCSLTQEQRSALALLLEPRGVIRLHHDGFVSALAFTPDGKALLTASGDKHIRVWDPATGKELRRLTGHKGPVLSLSLARDGKTLASGGQDETVRLWDVPSGKELKRLAGHRGDVAAVALSPDGKQVASGAGGIAGVYETDRRGPSFY
jgi:WD40 repeat protein